MSQSKLKTIGDEFLRKLKKPVELETKKDRLVFVILAGIAALIASYLATR